MEESEDKAETNDFAKTPAAQTLDLAGKPWSTTALISLFSSLLAVVIPVTTAIFESYKKTRELALKDKELEQKITMECLKLAVSKDTATSDRRQVLQAIATLNTPLHGWAKDRIDEMDKNIAEAKAQTDRIDASFTSKEKSTVALITAKDRVTLILQRIRMASSIGDMTEVSKDWELLMDAKAKEAVLGSSSGIHVGSKSSTSKSTIIYNQDSDAHSEVKTYPINAARITVEDVAKAFPDANIADIKQNLPLVLNALNQVGLLDRTMILIAMSTIKAENPTFASRPETASELNTSPGGHPFDLYDDRMENHGPPNGERFRGRGIMQLTGRRDYKRVSQALGLGNALVDSPEEADNPKIGAQILAIYLKLNESALRKFGDEDNVLRILQAETGGLHNLSAFRAVWFLFKNLLS